MLRKFFNIPVLRGQFILQLCHRLRNNDALSKLNGCDLCCDRSFHTSRILSRDWKKSQEKSHHDKFKSDGFETVSLSESHKRVTAMLPDDTLPTRIFNGIMYKDLPIVNIRVSQNNTIISLSDAKGVIKLIRSCGVEGFKNTKKGTNLAAQATCLTFSRRAIDMGYKTVRLRIQGIGSGRFSSLRGVIMGGLDVVSVTDSTHVSDHPPRPKKLRRI